jgi:hypothetical protein
MPSNPPEEIDEIGVEWAEANLDLLRNRNPEVDLDHALSALFRDRGIADSMPVSLYIFYNRHTDQATASFIRGVLDVLHGGSSSSEITL